MINREVGLCVDHSSVGGVVHEWGRLVGAGGIGCVVRLLLLIASTSLVAWGIVSGPV